ncbi:MAG TPA: ABC transporter permease [Bryobacteraceae bacterium]|nr:ABC transporter permease [Bryobacteraceae bacterium]
MIREWWSKLRRVLAGRQSLADDLAAEMAAQLDFEIEENLSRGMSPDEARQAARRRLGNLTQTGERVHEAWGFPRFETIAQDLRYGLRGLRRSPGFALVVILTLALGIGANTALFSVVNAVLLRPLPYPDAGRLVWLGESDPKADGISVTWVNFEHWRDENHSFEAMAGFETAHFTLTGRGDALLTRAGVATSGFLNLLGARPILGRVFSAADDRPGAPATVVLGYQFWIDRMGADDRAVGSILTLNGRPYQVIGVLPRDLHFFEQPMDFYLPLHQMQGEITDRARHGSMRLLARLKPGVTLAAATADLDAIMRHLAEIDPGPESQHRASAAFLSDSRTHDVRPTLLILLAAVGMVLLIACANVASLLLARSTARVREMAIRAAIGAGRIRLIRQLLTENLVLAAAGGALGGLLALWGARALVAIGPRDIPRLAETTFDWRVLVFASLLTLATGIFTGLAPVLTAGRVNLLSALKDSSRSATGRGGNASRSTLVVAEIAITLVLAFGAGLLLRDLIAAQTGNPGYDPEHVLALELVLPSSSYHDKQAIRDFYGRLQQDLRTLPGVAGVGIVNCPPSAGDCGDWFYSVLDRPAPRESEVPISLFNTADASYFNVMRIPLRAGRAFTEEDRSTAPRVAIINETLARKWWPNQPAVGHRIKSGGPYREGPILQIVGVAGDIGQFGLGTTPYPEIFLPLTQSSPDAMVLMIRTAGDPGLLAAAVRRHVAALDRNLPIQRLRPFMQMVDASMAGRRFSTVLLGLFAALAMILAAVGIYGLLNYWVRVREQEIAIRMALGAPRTVILAWAGRQALRLSLLGAGIGALGAWAASRWLADLVVSASPRNYTTLVCAAAAVIAIAMLAASLPVWRATRVDAAGRLHRA